MVSLKLKVKILTGGIILNFVAGNLNNWGALLPYVASYYHLLDPSITIADFSIVVFYAYIAESLTTVLISYIVAYLSLHNILCIFCTLFCTVMFFSSYILNPYLFSIVFGISLGSLSACVFLPSLWIIWNWITDNKSVSSGIILTGYNLGPIPFSILFTLLVNPHDYKASNEDSEGDNLFGRNVAENVPMAIRVLSICLLVCSWIGIVLMPRKMRVSDSQEVETKGKTLKELLKNLRFWNLFLMMALALTCQGYVQTLYKTIALNYINDDYFTTYVGIAAFFVGGIGRLVFGYLLNKFYWKKIMSLVYFVETILMLGLWFTLTDKSLYAFFIILYNFTLGSLYNNSLILTEKSFPSDKKAISFVCLSFIISFFMPYFMEKLITPVIGYFLTFVIVASFSFILILQLIFYEDKGEDNLLEN